MNTIAEKIASLLPALEARGDIYLFALGERDDLNAWEVILSSAWSNEGHFAAIREVAEAVVACLTPAELVKLSGVTVIPSDEPAIQDMPASLESAPPEEKSFIDLDAEGLEIERAFIFKARRPPKAGVSKSPAGSVAAGA